MSKICRFEFIPEALGIHHYHEAGASANVEVHLRATLAVLDRHFNEHQNARRLYMKIAKRSQYSNACYGAARRYQRRGAVIRPIGYYSQTLKAYPIHIRAYAGLALLAVDMLLG